VQASYWSELALQPCDRNQLDGGGWGRGKVFSAPPPPLSFLLPIVHPLGRSFFVPPVFHCLKNSRRRETFLRWEHSHEKLSPALQANRYLMSIIDLMIIESEWSSRNLTRCPSKNDLQSLLHLTLHKSSELSELLFQTRNCARTYRFIEKLLRRITVSILPLVFLGIIKLLCNISKSFAKYWRIQ